MPIPELITVKVVAVRLPICLFLGTEKEMYMAVFYNVLIYK